MLNLERSPHRKIASKCRYIGETMGEILQASKFARNKVEAVSSKTKKPAIDDPRTPITERRRREREKQVALQTIRSEFDKPSLQRARSRINFKVSPTQNCIYSANRVSPRNRPWARKTVLFPHPLISFITNITASKVYVSSHCK